MCTKLPILIKFLTTETKIFVSIFLNKINLCRDFKQNLTRL